jgi:hypothetical protein
MGEINLTAIEEFEELSKRFDFLPAEDRPGGGARAAREGDRQDQQDLARAFPRDLRRGERQVQGGLPAPVPWRQRDLR